MKKGTCAHAEEMVEYHDIPAIFSGFRQQFGTKIAVVAAATIDFGTVGYFTRRLSDNSTKNMVLGPFFACGRRILAPRGL